MTLHLLGTNFKTTPIKEMEPLFLSKEERDPFLDFDIQNTPLNALVVLMTCNRIEFYMDSPNIEAGEQWLKNRLQEFSKTSLETINHILKHTTQESSIIEHLMNVCCGTESMVFGENEILTQVKQAYDRAQKQDKTHAIFNKLFHNAITSGKRARSETEISRGAYSVSSIAIEAIREKRLDYFGRSILIVGTGTMGERCVKKLGALGHQNTHLINRTTEYAKLLGAPYHYPTLEWTQLEEKLSQFDIIIASTSAKQHIITTQSHINPNTLIIDLGVPRNIDPKLSDFLETPIITVGGLKEIADKNVNRRKQELVHVQAIIAEETQRFLDWAYYKTEKC